MWIGKRERERNCTYLRTDVTMMDRKEHFKFTEA